eukprot:EG_transcript_34496
MAVDRIRTPLIALAMLLGSGLLVLHNRHRSTSLHTYTSTPVTRTVPSYLSATSSSGRAKVYPFDAKRMDDLSSKGVDQVPSSVSRVDWRWFSVASVAGVIALLFAGRIRRLPVSPDGWKACLTATAAASVLSSATPVMALEEVFPLAPSVSIATAGPGHHAALAFKLGVEPLAT